MFLRMIKQIIRVQRQLEDARCSLCCHKTFSIEDSYRLFDVNQNGKVCVQEITQVLSEHNIELADVARLVEIIDTNDNGFIDFNEWCAALRPARPQPCRNDNY